MARTQFWKRSTLIAPAVAIAAVLAGQAIALAVSATKVATPVSPPATTFNPFAPRVPITTTVIHTPVVNIPVSQHPTVPNRPPVRDPFRPPVRSPYLP